MLEDNCKITLNPTLIKFKKKFKQKISYADKLGVPYVVLLGEDEIAENKCSVKNMATGEQITCSPEDAIYHILQGLADADGPLILES